MLNAIGLENVGVKALLKEKIPRLKKLKVPVIVNIFGTTRHAYGEVARSLDGCSGIAGLEVNISCPNIKKGGISFGTDPREVFRVVSTVRKAYSGPLMVKLSPNVADITAIARSAEDAGADILSLINTLIGMAIDIDTRRPRLGNITGGLSGPAIKPVAVRMVWEVCRSVSIPVVGIGGIFSGRDALEFIIAGASAVQIGTAQFVNPGVAGEVAGGIADYLRAQGMTNLKELVGQLENLFAAMTMKKRTRTILLGNVKIGGGAPVSVQAMTKTDTRNTGLTVRQIHRLERAGCEIVRVAVPDMEAARNLASIKRAISIPLVADIHFDYRLALEALRQGVDGLRINPGNIGAADRVKAVVEAAQRKSPHPHRREHRLPLEADPEGVKHPTRKPWWRAPWSTSPPGEAPAFLILKFRLNRRTSWKRSRRTGCFTGRYSIPCISASPPRDHPSGTIKSSIGIGMLLAEGIGDTIRVSLTGSPVERSAGRPGRFSRRSSSGPGARRSSAARPAGAAGLTSSAWQKPSSGNSPRCRVISPSRSWDAR